MACGVAALVYTSTFNVVFGGQEIVDGREEDLPYFPLDKVRVVFCTCFLTAFML